ncbi:MAG: FecR domain-containing protein, partial [Candidatus Solibacter usitatus]|nr:FecR domain-containing protein [Candidatus Solibacter usitatus]
MRTSTLRFAALLALTLGPTLWADDPDNSGRGVARLSVLTGDVSVRRGDSGDWVAAALNAPLVVGDRVLTGPNSRAELQLDWANIVRIANDSEVRLSELENRRYQVQVAKGLVTYRVLRDSEADAEISTPGVSVHPLKRGSYRILVREDGQTEVTVRSGEVDVYTPRGSERLGAGRAILVRGSSADAEFQNTRASAEDDWDRWNQNRDRDLERSTAYRYVPRDVYGAEDLDGYGSWVYDPPYGNVWVPRVAVGWAPYRYGRWSWIDWYGWSWVGYDPWGWAPYHYGRWYYGNRGWCWWPGSLHGRHYWSPGLVAFMGWGRYSGFHAGIGFGTVGWVPLAPYETYHPWYGRGYYGGYRNTTVNNVAIVNNVNIRNTYRNARVEHGVTALDGGDFTRGRSGSAVRLSDSDFQRISLVRGQLPVTPHGESLRLSDREVRHTGAARPDDSGRFISRRQTSAVDRVPFEDQRRSLEQSTRRTFETVRTDPVAGAGRVDPPTRTGGVERTERQDGWRRMGEPRGSDARSAETRPADRQAERQDWRRFGEPRGSDARSAETRPADRQAEPSGAGRVERQDGWRRFGEPGARDRVSGSEPANRGRANDSAGTPRADRPADREPVRRESNDGWRRFGDRRDPGAGDRPSPPARVERQDAPRFNGPSNDRQESIRMNPPIVRERSSPRYEAPRQEAPRHEAPRYQAPRQEAPRYEAPRYQAPRQESPAPRYQGGGGGSPRGGDAPRGGGSAPRGGD